MMDKAKRLADDGHASDLFARFTVGNLQCIALSDGAIATPSFILAPEVAPADLDRFLFERGEVLEGLMTPVTCLLVDMPDGRRLLIDSGLGSVSGPDGHTVATVGCLPAALAAAGIDPTTIDHALVSHIHPDHIGGIFDADGHANFANADYRVPREDAAFWGGDQPDLSGTLMPPLLQAATVRTAKRFLALADDRITYFSAGESPLPGVGSMILPGHTPGQVGFLIDGGVEQLFYAADAAGHAHISVEKPEWRFAFDTDAPLAVQTRRNLVTLLADRGWATYTPHFPWPGIGRFVHTPAGVRWQGLR